jgi:hypothetical protein
MCVCLLSAANGQNYSLGAKFGSLKAGPFIARLTARPRPLSTQLARSTLPPLAVISSHFTAHPLTARMKKGGSLLTQITAHFQRCEYR